MVDAAHEAVWFKAVRAMIRAAIESKASLALRRKMNKPALYVRTVLS